MKTYRAVFALITLAAVMTFGLVASAQEKPSLYQQWTMNDVTKILNDSPWAKTQTIRVAARRQVRSVAGGPPSAPMEGEGQSMTRLGAAEEAYDYKFTLRLRSSLAVRQAILRLVQLDQKYDQMSERERKAFNANAEVKDLLECKRCANNYIVSVGFGTNNSAGTDFVYQWFSGATLPSLKGYVYLANERGGRRDLVGFIPPKAPGDEAFFIFSRLDDKGQPLITPDNKKIIFRMADKSANSVTNFSLDVSKLVVDGKVDF